MAHDARLFFVFAFRKDLAGGEPLRRFDELLLSLGFIPHYSSSAEGQIWPILVPGWTLNYEVFFFALFFLGIVGGRPVLLTTLAIFVLVTLGQLSQSDSAVWITWTNEILLFFAIGILIAEAWKKVDLSSHVWAFYLGIALLVLCAFPALPPQIVHPAMHISVILTLIGTLALQDRYPETKSRLLSVLGDASYSIYLSHTILMIVLFEALAQLSLEGVTQFVVVTATTVVACALVGVLIHWTVERPMTRNLRKRFVSGERSEGA
ncbi:MAG: acyltransferase family protein [Pseudomonadota bacterium]